MRATRLDGGAAVVFQRSPPPHLCVAVCAYVRVRAARPLVSVAAARADVQECGRWWPFRPVFVAVVVVVRQRPARAAALAGASARLARGKIRELGRGFRYVRVLV